MHDDVASRGLETEALVRRYIRACEAGSREELLAVLGETGGVWHNTDNLLLPAEVAADRICATKANSAEMRIADVVLHPTPTGAVVQSVLHLTSKNGRHAEIPICCVVTVRDGRIQRWDDYYDSAAFRPFVAG